VQVNMKGMLLPLPRSAHKRPTVNDILKVSHRPPARPMTRPPPFLARLPACLSMPVVHFQPATI
jgi:hypothetical protein